jgi:transposase
MGKSIINLSSVTTVGLDLAKHVFQVHCVDASGCVVVAKTGDAQESGREAAALSPQSSAVI